jgi:pimeloyl-ACP methyl ester carboxylesterase
VGPPHDSRLYATEILLAITSSPLSWTPEGFSLIGYSLGGGICADFASSFPNLVNGIVLLAPAGLIRPHHFTWKNRLMYSGILPQSLLQSVVRRSQKAEAATSEEFKDESPPLSRSRPDVTIGSVVQWQVNNHPGFTYSFVSSLQNASIGLTAERRELWKKLGLRKDRVIVVAGSTDLIM